MSPPKGLFRHALAACLALFGGLTATGCAKTVYVRVPAVCPRDSECLAVGDVNVSPAEADAREKEFVRRAVESTVEVHGIRYNTVNGKSVTSGVGTIIGAKGYVLTTFQVIDRAEVITVVQHFPTQDGRYSPGREVSAYPLVSSVAADVTLLVLSANQTTPPPLTVRYGPPIAGDTVWMLGEHGPLSTGLITATQVKDRDVSEFADVRIMSKPSDSGSPVLNACGEIVGVAMGPYGKDGQTRMVPIEYALRTLRVTRADLR